jgi:hypothetical protein
MRTSLSPLFREAKTSWARNWKDLRTRLYNLEPEFQLKHGLGVSRRNSDYGLVRVTRILVISPSSG